MEREWDCEAESRRASGERLGKGWDEDSEWLSKREGIGGGVGDSAPFRVHVHGLSYADTASHKRTACARPSLPAQSSRSSLITVCIVRVILVARGILPLTNPARITFERRAKRKGIECGWTARRKAVARRVGKGSGWGGGKIMRVLTVALA